MSLNLKKGQRIWKNTIANFSKKLDYIPVTRRKKNSGGDLELIEGTTIKIKGAFFKRENIINPSFEGLFKNADAILLLNRNSTIPTKDSFLIFDGEKFQVRVDPIKRYLGSTDYFYMLRYFKYDG